MTAYLRSFSLCLFVFVTVLSANAQWQLVADGEIWPWSPDEIAESMLTPEQQAIRMLHQEGYLHAVVDSQDTQSRVFFVSLGDRARVRTVSFLGIESIDAKTIHSPLKQDDWITSDILTRSAEAILDAYSEEGYLLAEVVIEALIPLDSARYDVVMRVQEGVPARLDRIVLQGAKRTGQVYVRHVSGLTPGSVLRSFSPTDMQRKLEATGVFSNVDTPALYQATDSSVAIHVPVTESPPGAFDLALGYERAEGGRGALVGSGSLALRNLFGRGRTLELTLNRAPGQLGHVLVNAEAPLVLGLPLSLAVSFEGLQQDSTYGKRDYGLQLGYWIDSSTQIFASVAREITRPGLAGTEVIAGRQRIPIADALFIGGGIHIRQVDHALSPARGYLLSMLAETGTKDAERIVDITEPVNEQNSLHQGRLSVQGRVYVPLRGRSLLVSGGEIMVVRSRQLDESDLFRVGGAQSLRGYDEQRFRASLVTRLLTEFRYLIDRVNYGFGFFDLGYLEDHKTAQSINGWYPGFGVGFQISTAAGIINLTFASNTEDLSAVRAHIGLSLGL